MAQDVKLSASTRTNLLSLQATTRLIGRTQERLSTGLFHLLAPDLTPDLLKLLAVVHTSSEHRDLLLIWLLSGGTLALLIFSVTVVSVPLLLDRPLGLLVALRTSLRSVDANLLLMILWGAIIVVLTALGFLTLFFGLIVLMPLIGHASWHAYRELVE